MRGLTVIVATADGERFRAALALCCAHAALGARTRLYAHDSAVRLLSSNENINSQLIDEALELGVIVTVCQSGLAAAGIGFDTLATGIQAGGLVSLLASLDDDRLVSL